MPESMILDNEVITLSMCCYSSDLRVYLMSVSNLAGQGATKRLLGHINT